MRFKFVFVFVPQVPAFSPVTISSTPRGVYDEAIIFSPKPRALRLYTMFQL